MRKFVITALLCGFVSTQWTIAAAMTYEECTADALQRANGWHSDCIRTYPNGNVDCRSYRQQIYDDHMNECAMMRPRSNKSPKTTKSPSGSTRSSDGQPSKKVNVDPDPDWAGATRERILNGKQEKPIAVNLNPNRFAPYGSSSCAQITPKPNRGKIDWDFVVIRNACSYPIKVLTCYHDKGRDTDCVPRRGARGWGLSGVIKPGGTQDSIMTNVTAAPAKAKIVVCDMREKSDLLCTLP
ncbi:hypothetical protein [Ensifer adhaerens]|uniref:hypothetical protein n=1 Tax=Ensifer adhaerens TaxID=106592 RepID=UPI001319EF71|nr:hypothetical protein [Ensifer adhaerens]